MFPGQVIHLNGYIGVWSYPFVMNGTQALSFELTIEYDGPSGHYKECQKEVFDKDLHTFMNLGPQCTS